MIGVQKVLSLIFVGGLLTLGMAAHDAAPPGKKKNAVNSTSKKSRKATAGVYARQLNPTPDRYKQIQQALAQKGYLPTEQANGQWTEASADALKK
jgi:hypothetical protein